MFQEPPKDPQYMAEQQLVIDDVEKRCVTARSYIQETILSPFKDSFHHTLSAWIHDSKQSPKLVGDHLLFNCSVDTHRLYNAVDIVRRKCSAAISDFVEETVNKLNQSHQKQNEKLINKVVHCWDKSKLALLEGVVNYRTSLAATHLQAFVRDYLREVTLPILICVENFIQDCLYQPALDLCAAWSIRADYTYWYTKRWSELEELEREDYHEIDYINLLRQDLIRHHQFRMREADTAKPSKSQITHQEYVARTPQLLQRLLQMEGVKEELRERFRHLRWMEDDVEDEDEQQEMEDGEQQEMEDGEAQVDGEGADEQQEGKGVDEQQDVQKMRDDEQQEDGPTQLTIKYEVHLINASYYSVENVHKPQQDVKKGKILSIEISQSSRIFSLFSYHVPFIPPNTSLLHDCLMSFYVRRLLSEGRLHCECQRCKDSHIESGM